MTEERERVVWVLGSGFSRSLGGPLLKDLFGLHLQEGLLYRYGDLLDTPATRLVYAVFRDAIASRNWEHAEQFLEFIDSAIKDPPRRRQLLTWTARIGDTQTQPEALLAAAKRIVAAECCDFLAVVDEKSERAGPYIRWARSLGPLDAVITFNYDAVLEKLTPHGRFDVLTTSTWNSYQSGKRGSTPLFKLHGSVTWGRHADGSIYAETSNLELALGLANPVLAIPGRAKGDAVQGELASIWDYAKQSLQAADRVIILGYGWPPSDAEARRMLFDALLHNTKQDLYVHLVLGGNTAVTDRVSRFLELAGLRAGREINPVLGRPDPPAEDEMRPLIHAGYELRKDVRTLHIYVEPLYAEEFMEAYEPGML